MINILINNPKKRLVIIKKYEEESYVNPPSSLL